MAFSFFKWLLRARDAPEPITGDEFFSMAVGYHIRDLAFEACVDLIANAISKCEVKTYRAGAEVKADEYYLWNISPNQNQTSSAFWNQVIHSMYRSQAALVVENGGRLYVADSWNRQRYALYDDVFTGVTVGDFTFNRSFAASEVLFFELRETDVKRLIDGLYESYSELIACGMKGYRKSRGEKGVLELDTNAAGDPKFQEAYETIKNNGFRKFAESDNALMTLYKGMRYTSLASKTYNSDTTRDIRAMIDDVMDFTARGMGIPTSLVNGSVQDVDSATNQLLTFCIDPLADTLQEEINRKRNGRAGWRQGNYHRIDTTCIKHIDILDAAGKLSQLVGSGVECVNDIRALLGQSLINEPWAWQYFITKNYASAAEMSAEAEKGAKV